MTAKLNIPEAVWNTMTKAQQDAVLTAHNEAMANQPVKALSLKVSEKGAVSVYGLTSRFPLTLYLSQWQRLIPLIKDGTLDKFIEANKARLAVKPAKA